MALFHQASRRKSKARILLKGPSWGGKTTTALLMAYGMTNDGKGGHSWQRIAGIDTENNRMEMKAGMTFGDIKIDPFPVCQIGRPFTVEKYLTAIAEAEKMPNIDVIIIDSASHEWIGGGGILDQKDKMSASSTSNNNFGAWNILTPQHNRFVEAITTSTKHIIVTVRTKHGIVMVTGEDQKTKVQKVPLDVMMRDGFEFEFSWVLNMVDGVAMVDKDDSSMFPRDTGFIPGPETGESIISWINQGSDDPVPKTVLNRDPNAALCQCGSRATLIETEDVCGKMVGIYKCMAESKLFRKEVAL